MSDERKDKSQPLLSSHPSASSDSALPHPTAIGDAHGLLHTVGVLLRNRPLLFVVGFGCLGGLLFGYDIGVMGTPRHPYSPNPPHIPHSTPRAHTSPPRLCWC